MPKWAFILTVAQKEVIPLTKAAVKDMNQEQTKTKQIDYLVATLLDFFRHPKNELRFMDAAKFAINQLGRATNLPVSRYERRFFFFASKLKNNIAIDSIRTFATSCYEALENNPSIDLPTASGKPLSARTLYKRAQMQLSESLSSGHSEDAAIHRAANQLLKLKQKSDQEERIARLTQKHPLRDTLEALNSTNRTLAKEDIRQHLLRLKPTKNSARSSDGVLFSLLEKAQAFSASRLHKLLGDELFFLCRPLGFLDQHSSIVIVEVPTNAHLHALTYRKHEILKALKKDQTFRATKDIRLKVASTSF